MEDDIEVDRVLLSLVIHTLKFKAPNLLLKLFVLAIIFLTIHLSFVNYLGFRRTNSV